MGDYSQITGQGVKTMKEADVVYAFSRIAALYAEEFPDIIPCEYTDLLEKLGEEHHENIAVLVSGDVGFFSMAKTLRKHFEERYDMVCICGINSMQYLCAKVGISYEHVHILSLHGRDSLSKLLGGIAYNEYSFLLTGGQNTTQVILQYLKTYLLVGINGDYSSELSINTQIEVTIGDSLSMKDEQVVTGGIEALCEREDFSELTVMLIYNPNFKPKNQHYRDEAFIRSSVPMTKRDVRNLSIDYLDIKPTDTVYDIGAGTGSVTVELASFANEGMVYALEKDPEAYATILKNKEQFGSYNMIPIHCSALEQLRVLPVADKVFIGGSSGDLPEMLGGLFQRNPKVEILITAITLETINLAMQTLKERNLAYEVSCINSSYSRKLGSYNLMTANNPIYLIWTKQSEDDYE